MHAPIRCGCAQEGMRTYVDANDRPVAKVLCKMHQLLTCPHISMLGGPTAKCTVLVHEHKDGDIHKLL